jgi:hypothetical protein
MSIPLLVTKNRKLASFFFAYYSHVPPYVNNQKEVGFLWGAENRVLGLRPLFFVFICSSDP